MDDVIRLGAGLDPGRRIRRLIAAAVIVVLAAGIVLRLPDDKGSPRHRATTELSGGPVQLAGLGSSAARLLNKPGGADLQKPASGLLPHQGTPWAGRPGSSCWPPPRRLRSCAYLTTS
jgi:hypothetical protein